MRYDAGWTRAVHGARYGGGPRQHAGPDPRGTAVSLRSPRVCHISTMLGGMVAWCLWWHGTYQLVAAKSNRQN
jgi:hypothetical protein